MYTIKLADGTEITELSMNGTNYVSQTEIDTSIFNDNLSEMTVSDGETETTYHNVELIQQVQYTDGWYLAFRELTEQELKEIEINGRVEAVEASSADTEIALCELSEILETSIGDIETALCDLSIESEV